jgi:DNA-directed RNA polymerase subunit RPC12/RpoP
MGMFDTLETKCPNCSHVNSDQSKWGACILSTFYIENGTELSPAAAMASEDQIIHCEKCPTRYQIVVERRPKAILKIIKDEI